MLYTENMIEINLAHVGSEFLRPPKKELIFDVTVSNLTNTAKWVLFPFKMDQLVTDEAGGIFGYEIYELGIGAPLYLGQFQGMQSFQAILLGPSAKLKLNGLRIATVDQEVKDVLMIHCVVTNEVRINKQPLIQAFRYPALIEGSVAVNFSKEKLVHAQFTDTLQDYPVELGSYRLLKITVPTHH